MLWSNLKVSLMWWTEWQLLKWQIFGSFLYALSKYMQGFGDGCCCVLCVGVFWLCSTKRNTSRQSHGHNLRSTPILFCCYNTVTITWEHGFACADWGNLGTSREGDWWEVTLCSETGPEDLEHSVLWLIWLEREKKKTHQNNPPQTSCE